MFIKAKEKRSCLKSNDIVFFIFCHFWKIDPHFPSSLKACPSLSCRGVWVGGKVKDNHFERTWKCGGCNLNEWKVGGLQVIVSGIESGGGRPKVRTEREGQALREDGKWGSIFQKWQKIKKTMSFDFKHDLFSFQVLSKWLSFTLPPTHTHLHIMLID
jgi:hypothetical protein